MLEGEPVQVIVYNKVVCPEYLIHKHHSYEINGLLPSTTHLFNCKTVFFPFSHSIHHFLFPKTIT